MRSRRLRGGTALSERLCYWPDCGKPATRDVTVGDDAGFRIQPICGEHFKRFFEE